MRSGDRMALVNEQYDEVDSQSSPAMTQHTWIDVNVPHQPHQQMESNYAQRTVSSASSPAVQNSGSVTRRGQSLKFSDANPVANDVSAYISKINNLLGKSMPQL
jgi:hypothetical protein